MTLYPNQVIKIERNNKESMMGNFTFKPRNQAGTLENLALNRTSWRDHGTRAYYHISPAIHVAQYSTILEPETWIYKWLFQLDDSKSLHEQRKIFVTSSNWRGVPTSFSSPVWFLKAWPRTPLPYRVCMPYLFLTGWLVAGCSGWPWLAWLAGWLAGAWLVAGWLAGRRAGWLAGWAWLAGLAGRLVAGWLGGWLYILYDYGWLVFDGCGLPGFMGMNLTSFWPRFDLVLDLVPVLPLNLHLLYWLY